MDRTSAYLTAMIDYWGNVGKGALRRLAVASEDVRNRTYGTERLVSDVVGLWMDGVDGWWGALRGPVAPSAPTVLFKVNEDATQVKKASPPINVPGIGQPVWTDIQRIGGAPDEAIPRDHVDVTVSAARDGLTITLKDLRRLRLRAGQYHGLVYIDEIPLVTIHVLVSH
jgi:hypothetical protein